MRVRADAHVLESSGTLRLKGHPRPSSRRTPPTRDEPVFLAVLPARRAPGIRSAPRPACPGLDLPARALERRELWPRSRQRREQAGRDPRSTEHARGCGAIAAREPIGRRRESERHRSSARWALPFRRGFARVEAMPHPRRTPHLPATPSSRPIPRSVVAPGTGGPRTASRSGRTTDCARSLARDARDRDGGGPAVVPMRRAIDAFGGTVWPAIKARTKRTCRVEIVVVACPRGVRARPIRDSRGGDSERCAVR